MGKINYAPQHYITHVLGMGINFAIKCYMWGQLWVKECCALLFRTLESLHNSHDILKIREGCMCMNAPHPWN